MSIQWGGQGFHEADTAIIEMPLRSTTSATSVSRAMIWGFMIGAIYVFIAII